MDDIQNNKPIQPQVPSSEQPVSVGAPGGAKEVERPVSDFVKPSEELKKIDRELSDIGVEQTHEQPQLDEIHEQVGIMHSPADTPVNPDLRVNAQLPLTEEEAKQAIAEYKNKVTYDVGEHGEHDAYIVPSRLGLATLVDKINKFINLFKPKKRDTV